jgi:hypothetical protein
MRQQPEELLKYAKIPSGKGGAGTHEAIPRNERLVLMIGEIQNGRCERQNPRPNRGAAWLEKSFCKKK